MNQHRHTVNIPVKAQNHPILSKAQNDPTLRVMIFCASEGNGKQDIAFPHQSEVKVNGGDVKANLRGLKNKPGSTRPVDITKELRLKVLGYQNTVEMTYALTTKAGLNTAFVASEVNKHHAILPCFSPGFTMCCLLTFVPRNCSANKNFRNSIWFYMWSS